jgi:hypothetical protein
MFLKGEEGVPKAVEFFWNIRWPSVIQQFVSFDGALHKSVSKHPHLKAEIQINFFSFVLSYYIRIFPYQNCRFIYENEN